MYLSWIKELQRFNKMIPKYLSFAESENPIMHWCSEAMCLSRPACLTCSSGPNGQKPGLVACTQITPSVEGVNEGTQLKEQWGHTAAHVTRQLSCRWLCLVACRARGRVSGQPSWSGLGWQFLLPSDCSLGLLNLIQQGSSWFLRTNHLWCRGEQAPKSRDTCCKSFHVDSHWTDFFTRQILQ